MSTEQESLIAEIQTDFITQTCRAINAKLAEVGLKLDLHDLLKTSVTSGIRDNYEVSTSQTTINIIEDPSLLKYHQDSELTIIWDFDETLIKATGIKRLLPAQQPFSVQDNDSEQPATITDFTKPKDYLQFKLFIRPGVLQLLNLLARLRFPNNKVIRQVIWTASKRSYIASGIHLLDPDNKIFSDIICRNEYADTVNWSKDGDPQFENSKALSFLAADVRNHENLVLFDNNSLTLIHFPSGIKVDDFSHQSTNNLSKQDYTMLLALFVIFSILKFKNRYPMHQIFPGIENLAQKKHLDLIKIKSVLHGSYYYARTKILHANTDLLEANIDLIASSINSFTLPQSLTSQPPHEPPCDAEKQTSIRKRVVTKVYNLFKTRNSSKKGMAPVDSKETSLLAQPTERPLTLSPAGSG